MKMLRATWLAFLMLVALGAGLWAPRPAFAADEAVSAPKGRLVSAEWLKGQLGRPDLLLLDASMTPAHKAAHIPGAVGVDLYRYGPREATAAEWEQRLQAWGLSPGQRIVVYDEDAYLLILLPGRAGGVRIEGLLTRDSHVAAFRPVGVCCVTSCNSQPV